MDLKEFRKGIEENELEYIYRVCSRKDVIGTWVDVAEILNKNLNYEYTESKYRKTFQSFERMLDANKEKFAPTNGYLAELIEQKRALETEKVKVRDERIDYQKTIREAARRESLLELVKRVMQQTVASLDYKPSPTISSKEDMIVCLSDLHVGMEVDNWWNTFNTDILKRRLSQYIDEIIEIQSLHKCKICNVVLGGDNISGLIHVNMRLQNNENVIEQVKIASRLISDFLYELQDNFEEINVYGISGNHSRLTPKKEDCLKGEELDELILYCISLEFSKNEKVIIAKNPLIDNTINGFTTRGGKRFYIVHGDKDTPKNVVKNLSMMTGIKPDGIIMGHRHHNALDSEHGVKVIQCGCVIGTDDYCIDNRISGVPEQCVIITNDKSTIKCMYDVSLD